MKRLLTGILLGIVVISILIATRRIDEQDDGVARLRDGIDDSMLPGRARSELLELLDQRRIRPSQFTAV